MIKSWWCNIDLGCNKRFLLSQDFDDVRTRFIGNERNPDSIFDFGKGLSRFILIWTWCRSSITTSNSESSTRRSSSSSVLFKSRTTDTGAPASGVVSSTPFSLIRDNPALGVTSRERGEFAIGTPFQAQQVTCWQEICYEQIKGLRNTKLGPRLI